MALGQKNQNRPPITYVQLGRGEDYGFKHNVNELDAGGKPVRVTKSYDHVTGIPVGFYVKEELIYEVAKALREKNINPQTADLSKFQEDEIKHVATVMLRDPESGEMVGVTFDMHDSLGGKIVGMLNAARLNGTLNQDFNLRTFYAAPHSKYNDSDKGRSSINMRANGSNDNADDIKPVFLAEDGSPLMDAEHPDQFAKLPMGKVSGRVKGKDVWEFSERNLVITNTAVTLLDHFKKPESAPADEEVDVNEAARVAGAAPAP